MQSRLGAGPDECPSRHHHTRGMNTSYFRGSLYPSITSGVDDQDLYTIVITTYIPPRQVGDGPWTPWYADYYHPAV